MAGLATYRMTANSHGVCLASSGGYIWGFPHDAEPFGWKVPEVYQGWLVARLTEEGVLATAEHDGRTGEVVLLDYDGCWYDAFDSQWNSLTPAVSVRDGYLVGLEDEVGLLGGHPLRKICEDVVGDDPYDAHASEDGEVVVWVGASDRGVVRRRDGDWINERHDMPCETESLRPVAEATQDLPRWTWQRRNVPELPELSPAIPAPKRTEELIDKVRRARDADASAIRDQWMEEIRQEFPWLEWESQHLEEPRATVFKRLRREVMPPRPTRRQVRVLAQRAFDPGLSEFERFHGRVCFPGELPADTDGASIDDLLDTGLLFGDEVATVQGEEFQIRRASLSGRLTGEGVRWRAEVDLRGSPTIVLETNTLPDGALTEGAGEGDQLDWMSAEGTYGTEPLSDSRIGVEPFYQHAHRLHVESRSLEMWFECPANFRGLRCVDCDSVQNAMELAARHIDLEGWYVEPTDDGFCFSPFAADLEAGQPCQKQAPDRVVVEIVDQLVDDELVILSRDLTDDELRRLQKAFYSGDSARRRVECLEEVLFDLDAVEELFGTTDQLVSVVETMVWGVCPTPAPDMWVV